MCSKAQYRSTVEFRGCIRLDVVSHEESTDRIGNTCSYFTGREAEGEVQIRVRYRVTTEMAQVSSEETRNVSCS